MGVDTASTVRASNRGRQGSSRVQQANGSGSVQRLWVADLLSRTELLWVQLSQGTLSNEQGDRAEQGGFKARNQDRLAFATAQSMLFIHRLWYARIVQKKREIHHI